MLVLKNVTLKNFMSVGAVSQSVDFTQNGLTLVLGENLDMGGNGNRNGVGKTSIVNGISYALFGQAITNIKKDNLINTVNKKNMVVSIEFSRDGKNYRIERGRKPNFFKYYVDDKNVTDSSGADEAQGENKDTQKDIDQVLGVTYTMFKHIVALNTYTEPFLSMGSGKQREIIEELLGITLLSQKADSLKELIKVTKTQIEREEFQINTIKNSNQRILSTLSDLDTKIKYWDKNKSQEMDQLQEAILGLSHLDIDGEIEAHKQNAMRRELLTAKKSLEAQLSSERRHLQQVDGEQTNLLEQYASLQSHSCPMCGQDMHDSKHEQLITDLEKKIAKNDHSSGELSLQVEALASQMGEIEDGLGLLPALEVTYDSLEAALDHKNSLAGLEKELLRVNDTVNPYLDQKQTLNDTLQDVSYDNLNELTNLKEHQEFLLKLLTNKDSFIRKKIIDQNLAYLNHRMSEYLNTLGISHSVKFSNDLGVEINYMGQDMDFHNLSRGEQTRVILSLSWSFRDIFENMNTSINFMMIDEILDQGTDQSGVEKALEILKGMTRDRGKNIFLISHREELVPRVSNILTVFKEDGFSRFETGTYES